MKRSSISFYVIIAFVISLGSCKLIDKLTQFNVDYSTNFTIPPTAVTGLPIDLNLTPSEVNTNSAQTFSDNNTSGDHIKEVMLKKLTLTITSPAGRKFDFLKSASIYLSASGLPEVLVASIDNINAATVGSSIELTPTSQDLKAYLIKPAFTIREVAKVATTLTESVDVRADAQFFVQGSIKK
ncbi:MAG: hypothetical protein JWN78_2340 [Bacteroidota bacterium]|nr:hypothetical protein [Bacteroidota bacterium]